MEVGGRGERKGVIPIETKHRQTLESSRDPAESERTLCRDGRASTGYVSDIEEEKKRLNEQKANEGPSWDIVPPIKDDNDDE